MSSDSDIDQDPYPPSDHCDDPCTCRPALPRMKSCLKSSPSQSGAATPVHTDAETGSLCKKRVAFSEQGTEQVFQADEWDRTPTEIAQRLSYEDVLELKMIQRSLPRAEQQHDPLSSRPYSSVFLRHVPIPLLPLNPTTVSASAPPPSISPSSPPSSPPAIRSPHSSPPRRTGYTALDLHPNSILFSSPPKRRSKPSSPQWAQSKMDYRPPHSPPPPFQGFNVPAILPPPPAPSELRPHNIVVPPPPVPPIRTSTAPLLPIPSNLPPPKRFTILPLLDDTSSSSSSFPRNEGKRESEDISSPQTDTTLSPTPSPTLLDNHYPRSDSSSEVDHSYSSDTDCSLFASDTEFSTPSLTTASLASSSPPESPRMPYTDSPTHEHAEESFILNLDTDSDIDTASFPSTSDSYFPRVSMSMTPISSLHMRYPHRVPPPSLIAVPSPDLPVPSPLDLSQKHPHAPALASRRKLSMPVVPLAEAPAPSSMREKGYSSLKAGGEGRG